MEQHDIIEIRTYQLKPGCGATFHQLLSQQSLPLLQAAGETVLAAQASLHDPDQYLLVRAYPDLTGREQRQQRFYSSSAWRDGPRAAMLGCITHSTDILLPASAFTHWTHLLTEQPA